MPKQTYDFYFNFHPDHSTSNDAELAKLTRLIDKGCVENIESIFDISFAAGIENGKPFYLTLSETDDDLIKKYDGMVDLTVPPQDNKTREPFKREKLKFTIEYVLDKKENEKGWRAYINSKLRNVASY